MTGSRIIHGVVVIALGVLIGCGQQNTPMRMLDDMRRQGLINDDPNQPMPTLDGTEAGADASPQISTEKLQGSGALSLDDLLQAADELNPRLVAARSRIGMAGAEAWQASLYPNPTFGVESENIRPSDGGFGVSETKLSIAQPIIVSDRRTAGVAAAKSRMDAERLALEALRREIHGKVRREATEITFLRRAITLHNELRDLTDRTVNIAETRFEAKAAPESEAIRARVEANTLAIRIQRLEGELAEARERLAALLGGYQVDASRIQTDLLADPMAGDLPTLYTLKQSVRDSHPSIRSKQAQVRTAQRNIELEQARRNEDITARLAAGVNHADDEAVVQAGIGIPLPIFDENQGNVLRARFELIRARKQASATTNELLGALGEAYHACTSAVQRYEQFQKKILNDASRAYDQATTGYEAGHLAFVDLLDAQRTLIDARIAELELLRAANMAQADLHAIVGQSLNRKKPQGDRQ